MKKSIPFVVAAFCLLSFIPLQLLAQARPAVGSVPTVSPAAHKMLRSFPPAAKPTSGGSRWYNYGDFLLQVLPLEENDSIGFAMTPLWYDTMGHAVTNVGDLWAISIASVASVLHPQASVFNRPEYYGGEIMVDSSSSYSIDSIRLYGFYNVNPAKLSVVDTLFITLIGSNDFIDTVHYFSLDTITYGNLHYNAVTRAPEDATGTSLYTFPVPLYPSMLADTMPNGMCPVTIPVSLSGSPAGRVGVALAFKSGDPAFPATTPGDTVCNELWVPKYNYFFPINAFTYSGAGYVYPGDNNIALYHDDGVSGFDGVYTPQWWYMDGMSTTRQSLYVDWHVNCTSCPLVPRPAGVGNVAPVIGKVYPSPAVSQVTVETNIVDAVISFTDVLGRCVQENKLNGRVAQVDVSRLSPGIYTYQLASGATRQYGKLVILR